MKAKAKTKTNYIKALSLHVNTNNNEYSREVLRGILMEPHINEYGHHYIQCTATDGHSLITIKIPRNILEQELTDLGYELKSFDKPLLFYPNPKLTKNGIQFDSDVKEFPKYKSVIPNIHDLVMFDEAEHKIFMVDLLKRGQKTFETLNVTDNFYPYFTTKNSNASVTPIPDGLIITMPVLRLYNAFITENNFPL